jgi:hypothetical protein
LGGAAHLIGDGCFILVVGELVIASHAGVIAIPADTVGPTVPARRRLYSLGSSSSVASSPFRASFDYFGGAAHLVGEGCCVLVIGVLILASHAGVTAILAAAMGPTVAATRRSSTFFHFFVLYGSRKGCNRCLSLSCVSLINTCVYLLFPSD